MIVAEIKRIIEILIYVIYLLQNYTQKGQAKQTNNNQNAIQCNAIQYKRTYLKKSLINNLRKNTIINLSDLPTFKDCLMKT